MRLFNSECFYNAELKKWDERYWIDGRATDADNYFYQQELEKEIENKKLQNREFEDNPCDVCPCRDCCEDDEFDYEDLLDVFVEKILATEGCPGCIADVLDELVHLFLPDDDEYEEDFDCEECCEELVGCVEPAITININIENVYSGSDGKDIVEKIVKTLKNIGV